MINITEIIKNNHITTHHDLQRYLRDLSGGEHYWEYYQDREQWLIEKGLMRFCEPVELENSIMYYENCVIK